jgi:hypothetical protein
MNSRELVELAALVAVRSRGFAQRPGRIPHAAIEQYWTAARCRVDRWLRLLKELATASQQLPLPAKLHYSRVRPILEEILAGEPLSRIFAAAATAYDEARGDADLAPIARNILAGQLDARCRLLQLLAEGRAIDLPSGVALNHLRRRLERWTDLLLAHLAPLIAIDEFAFDPARARDFAADLEHEAAAADPNFTLQLMCSSLRSSLAGVLEGPSPNIDLNRRLAVAIFDCLGDQAAAATNAGRSAWLDRLGRAAGNTQALIDDLLRLDAGLPAVRV